MRAVVQRVSRASVTTAGQSVARIGTGLLVFVGVAAGDGPTDIEYIASKVRDLRVFADDQGKMNRSLTDVAGGLLVVSQFTIMGDVRKGRRPAFDGAASPEPAREIYDALIAKLRENGPVASGVFQSQMDVELVNDGPVTILLDSRRLF